MIQDPQCCGFFCASDSAPLASSHPGFPVTNAVPDQGAGGGDSDGLDQFKVAIIKQIPGDDADEHANAFGYRECRARCPHGV